MKKYLKILAKTMDREVDDPVVLQEFNTMSPNELFDLVCTWEGMIGYSYEIKSWVKDIYGVDLDEL